MAPSRDRSASLEAVKAEIQRLKALKAFQMLQGRIQAQQQAYKQLKAAAKEELAARSKKHEHDELAGELKLLRLSEQNMSAQPMSGQPDWALAGAGDTWCPWVVGTEFIYSLQKPPLWKHRYVKETQLLSLSHPVYVEERIVLLQVCQLHFSKGGTRMAYYARDNFGGRFVMKTAIMQHQPTESQLADAHMDAIAQATAQHVASSFNDALRSTASKSSSPWQDKPALAAVVPNSAANASIHFHPLSVVVLPPVDGRPAVYLKEQLLSGKFAKWVRNDGAVLVKDPILEAFAHYSLEYSRKYSGMEFAVLDLQGCSNNSGSDSKAREAASSSSSQLGSSWGVRISGNPMEAKHYQLSDPACCSRAGGKFGRMDLGEKAVEEFCKQLVCGELCKAVRAVPI